MAAQPASLKWGRIVAAVIGGYVVSFLVQFCVVSLYATLLAFQARGAPNMDAINAFADQNSSWLGGVAAVVASALAAAWAVRKVEPGTAQLHGLIIGAGVGLVGLILDFVLGGLGLLSLVIVVLAVGGGWLGSMLGRKR
jgi:hypothetical protein